MTNSDLSFKDIDIVTDVDTLTELLAFFCGPRAFVTSLTQPSRLDLCTIHNTLFIIPKVKPGRGYAGPLPKHERPNPKTTMPAWADGVFARMGSTDPKLPYSGGHYRLVRYNFGDMVLAVRVKVDFIYEPRETRSHASCDPPYRASAEVVSTSASTNGIPVRKTTVKVQGLGTQRSETGMATVRYLYQSHNEKLGEMIPRLWFSRTTFLAEGVVKYPSLEIKEASLIDCREYYRSFETGHRGGLRHLAGLLEHMQRRTRELGGNAVMICDPAQVCFVILKPVIKTKPVPEDIILEFWGSDDDSVVAASESDKASASGSESDLTQLSKTPSPPNGSGVLEIGKTEDHKTEERTKKQQYEKDAWDGYPNGADGQQAAASSSNQKVGEWMVNLPQPSENERYESDVEDNTSCAFAGGDDEHMTDNDDLEEDYDDYMPISGSYHQQESLFEGRDALGEEHSEENYFDSAGSLMKNRHVVDTSDSDHTYVKRAVVEQNSNIEDSAEDPTLVAHVHQEQRSTPDDSNGLYLDGAATPGGDYRYQSSSDDNSPTTAAHPQQLGEHRPIPSSVRSDTDRRGAATPIVD